VAEAEELLVDGALVATRFAHEFWRRHRPKPELAQLVDSRERVECFIVGLLGACPPLAVAVAPLPRTLLGRLVLRIPRHLNLTDARPGTDGRHVLLPRELVPLPNDPQALRRYRLFALVQTLRIERETHAHAPADKLERDLFVARDGAVTLQLLAARVPRLDPDIAACVDASLAARPPLDALTPLERAVEERLRDALRQARSSRASAGTLPGARALLVEVQAAAAALRAEFAGRYRGLPGADCWGELVESAGPSQLEPAPLSLDAGQRSPPRAAPLPRRPKARYADPNEDDERPGLFVVKPDASQQSVEDPLGMSRPIDQGQADSAELSDALSDLPEARIITAPGPVREILLAEGVGPARVPQRAAGAASADGSTYPEWNYRSGSYREGAVTVRETAAALGEPDWALQVLKRQARLLHTVCECFARLRPRRERLRGQPDGAEVDIDAYVTGFADRLAGSSSDDGLYEDVRPRRRDVAVLLLIDCSASTDASIRGRERIVDVEKEALLLVCKALESLGDRYAAYGFSGETARGVRILPIKRFDEPYDSAVERRIAALEPDRYTRLGAALRHATALLASEQAHHGLLLIVSDGKPNDVDEYEGRYGIEDARQAIIEARLQGLHPFCITVDRQAPEYARHVFGATGYTLLRDPRTLPAMLLELLRRLVSS
jgi:nitric oxide reductase NorD protein